MKKMNSKTKATLLVVSLLLLVAVGATIAFYISGDYFRNTFRVKAPGVAMYELFDPTDQWTPEEEKTKEVMFENTGGQDMLLRFKIEAEWDESSWDPPADADDAAKAKAKADKENRKSPEDVLTYYWNIGEDNQLGNDNKDRLPGASPGNTDCPVDFVKIGEYYYYTKILKGGQSTQMILESVGFSPYLSNDPHGVDYSGKQINISMKGETVLAVEAAANEMWGKDGVLCTIPEEAQEDGTEVKWEAVTVTPEPEEPAEPAG